MEQFEQSFHNISYDPKLLSGKKRLHFVGIGGSGMFPLVQILHAAGYTITGSDVLEGDIIQYERQLGIFVSIPHAAENVEGADLVIYSAAILPGNPELARASQLGIPMVERSVMLGYVQRMYPHSICIAGTHGKTTTTGMTTQILQMAGRDPAAVIGGKLPLIDGYGKAGKGDNIVVESCEFSNTFLHLAPWQSVILNIDNDHLDFFGSMENSRRAFRKFAQLTQWKVLANADDADTMKALSGLGDKVVPFGRTAACHYQARDIRQIRPAFYGFGFWCGEEKVCDIALSVPGAHNVYNALAAAASAHLAGLGGSEIAAGLAAFRGTGRRFEILGHTSCGAVVADDYAHHPTELAATLNAAKQMGFRKVFAVFQPFTYSRTKLLLDDFARVLSIADQVVMTEIMGSRETNDQYHIYTADLAAKIPGSVWYPDFEGVVQYACTHAGAEDLILTLGCGDIYKAAKMMLGR
ncbi:MAG: UDP-N-acetylmuramate--L-alanine ligase [Pygmaiobacter massiliensis]|nr:UDP-N-acetylmuramate--L-alanine ligase [Pygmaiobacter massiliensis]